MSPQLARLRRWLARLNAPLLLGGLIVAAIGACAVAAPLIAPFDPYAPQIRFVSGQMARTPYPPGSFGMLLGSDTVARDIFSRLIYGSRYTLLFCGVSALLRVLIGALLGMLAAWYSRPAPLIDVLVSAWSAVPSLIFALVPIAVVNVRSNLAISTITFIVALSLTGWAETAIRTKIAVQGLRALPFVEAAQATGLGRGAILWRHIVPNLRDLLLVEAAFAMAATLLLVGELGFLNVFVGAAERDIVGRTATIIQIHAEWGGMLARGVRERSSGFWLLLAPMGAFSLAILAFNLLAEGLRRRR
jgi:peptide/nickel transport system permease protein